MRGIKIKKIVVKNTRFYSRLLVFDEKISDFLAGAGDVPRNVTAD